RFERLLFPAKEPALAMTGAGTTGAGGSNGPSPVGGATVEAVSAEPGSAP
ncbi:MAG: hypothetical protein JO368_11540, partial [Acidimicrobiales bacterium]|nr:hypothetical protein [Acidimicrobiales bacterium]